MISVEEFLAGRGAACACEGGDDAPADDVPQARGASIAEERRSAPRKRRADGARHDRGARMRRGSSGFMHAVTQDTRDVDACREAALRLLDAAARSTGSMRERLGERGYDDDVVEEVVGRLIELGLLDDEAYARAVVRHCVGRMMGERGAVAEMIRKGVARDVARRVAREAGERGDFERAAWELGRSVARRTAGMDPQVGRRRFWSAGGRKGHDPQTLRDVAQSLFDPR